jgi:hypothetical protein
MEWEVLADLGFLINEELSKSDWSSRYQAGNEDGKTVPFLTNLVKAFYNLSRHVSSDAEVKGYINSKSRTSPVTL